MVNQKSLNYMNKIFYITLFCFILLGCGPKNKDLVFKKVSSDITKIEFVNTIKDSKELNILDYLYYYNGGGVATGDINNDGLPDIYFTSNLSENKLYLNKGNFKFEDITEQALVKGNSDWNSGTAMADVNGDGYLDIYVCAVVGINGFDGRNELFINNGDSTFTESAADYGLDFETYASTASFFDYDNDGDLDMYLLNHAVHSVNSYGPAEIRNKRVYESGDKLLRNDDGFFTDVSEDAGIYGGANSYGLGVATSDFNNDGYTDIYVCNDFHEDDYYYINNGDGTFTESVKMYFGHTSRFSMGSDVADINHDGYSDILSLDMLPKEESVLKSTDGDESIDVLNLRINQLNYHYQFTRNMLQINREGKFFSETALFSQVAATDWSWSALFGDYNQDGEQDLFVFNGIPRRPNGLDFIKYISNEQIQKKMNLTKLIDNDALKMMPSGAVQNFIFKGSKGIKFEDMSSQWIENDSIISNGSAYADFDNDGDLDVVTNNLNVKPTVYQNQTDQSANFLKIRFSCEDNNTYGIGTKVYSYHDGILQYKQLFTTKGFQSSSEPLIHMGYGKSKKIDSLRIIWPDQSSQLLIDINVNQTLILKHANANEQLNPQHFKKQKKQWFKKLNADSIGINYRHIENHFSDFNRQKLIPYKISDKGPAVAVGDLDGDGDDDIFFGSSKNNVSKIYWQNNGLFNQVTDQYISNDSLSEDVSATINDFNNDGINDIAVVSAGGEFYGNSAPLSDKIYLNSQNQTFQRLKTYPEYFENGSVIKSADFDEDGDLDMFIGGAYKADDYGSIPNSYLLVNNEGQFSFSQNEDMKQIGMVTDAIWTDYNDDGKTDLIVIGEWMSPTFFKNVNNKLVKDLQSLDQKSLNGLWQCIEAFDIDDDGDNDYILGNWGLNSKLVASKNLPMKMYHDDFDNNGKSETIIAIAKNGKYFPIHTMDELSSQMVTLIRKKFTTYNDFSKQDLEGIFSRKLLSKATLFTVNKLESGYLENDHGKFKFHAFGDELQYAPVTRLLRYDFDGDGSQEVLSSGNFFGVIPFHSRFGSNSGNMILKNGNVLASPSILGINFSNKMIKGLNIIQIDKHPYLMVTINDNATEIYKINIEK